MELKDFVNLAIGVPFKNRGRDYKGWDCWGLAVKAYQECYGLELVDFINEYESALKSKIVAEIIERHKLLWKEIDIGKEEPGDIILLRYGSWPCHMGLIIEPDKMLHVESGIETCIEYYNRIIWKNRIMGFFRHANRAK